MKLKKLTKRMLSGADAAYVTNTRNIRVDKYSRNKDGKLIQRKSYFDGSFSNHQTLADFAYGSKLGVYNKLKPGRHV